MNLVEYGKIRFVLAWNLDYLLVKGNLFDSIFHNVTASFSFTIIYLVIILVVKVFEGVWSIYLGNLGMFTVAESH